MSSSANVVELLPISMTKLSQEFGKEHNRLIHFSSLVILISTNNNWLITILNAFNAQLLISHHSSSKYTTSYEGTTSLPRISTGTSFPTCPTIFLVESSPETFNNTKFTRQS
jgi:hypothetical protein